MAYPSGPQRGLVTGGAGFIGSAVVDALVARDVRVLALDDLSQGVSANLDGACSRGADLAVLDLRDGEALRAAVRASARRGVPQPATVDALDRGLAADARVDGRVARTSS